MAKNRTIQIYRGTTAQNDAYTGFAGELTMDTDKKEIRLHDGSTQGGKVIGAGYHPDLFTWQWADHELNDVQWLRADTFSWQSGAVYQAAYQHLADDYENAKLYAWIKNGDYVYTKTTDVIDGDNVYNSNGIVIDTVEWHTGNTIHTTTGNITYTRDNTADFYLSNTETIAGITISFYLADDGHKICPASEESNVTAIYNATGVAWYYIIDTTNQRFKLPRTKFGVTGLRDTVGNYVAAGLPNITGAFTPTGLASPSNPTGCFSSDSSVEVDYSADTRHGYGVRIGFDASDSNSIYGNSTTVQPPATQMYLYFYVGNFTQTALENTAGLNASLFNNKADLDFNNTNMIDYVVEKQDPTAGNNYTWYRKYKSGWVEQGGIVSGTGAYAKKTVNLPITMADTNYFSSATIRWGTESAWYTSGTNANGKAVTDIASPIADITTVSFSIQAFSTHVWEVKGMAA